MTRKRGFKTTSIPKSKFIHPPAVPPSGLLQFSFKYLDLKDQLFSLEQVGKDYFIAFLERLKALSGWKAKDFHYCHSKALRAHPIDWTRPSIKKNGFGIPNGQDFDEAAHQFSISKKQHGRVHGFFIDDTFYIVWLDPNHELDPGLTRN